MNDDSLLYLIVTSVFVWASSNVLVATLIVELLHKMDPEERLNNLLQLQRDRTLERSAQVSQGLPQRQHQSGPGGPATSTNSGSIVPLTAPVFDNPTPPTPSIQQSSSSGMTIHPTTLSNGIQVITRP